jgi:hypothetical protein
MLNAPDARAILRPLTPGCHFAEFADLMVPPFAITLGFSDQSWHNDAAARMEKTLPDGRVFTLWVDYPDREQRECNFARYTLYVGPVDADGCDTDEHELVIESEHEQDVTRAIERVLAGEIFPDTSEA